MLSKPTDSPHLVSESNSLVKEWKFTSRNKNGTVSAQPDAWVLQIQTSASKPVAG